MNMRSEQSWNRRCALEFTGQLFSGLGKLSQPEDLREAAEWALAWLEDRPQQFDSRADSEPELPSGAPEKVVAKNWLHQDVPAPGWSGNKVAGLSEVAQRIRSEVLNGLQKVYEAPSASFAGPFEAPPRNVPIEGDGSMTVPVYRFYSWRPTDSGVTTYWREDTRNEVNRWSVWLGADPVPRWHSQRIYDSPGRHPDLSRSTVSRVTAEELPVGVFVETRHDTEE